MEFCSHLSLLSPRGLPYNKSTRIKTCRDNKFQIISTQIVYIPLKMVHNLALIDSIHSKADSPFNGEEGHI